VLREHADTKTRPASANKEIPLSPDLLATQLDKHHLGANRPPRTAG